MATELLGFNNKQENNGVNNRGRLTANEFNQLVNAVNQNTTRTDDLLKRTAGLSLDIKENEEEYENLETKEENTIYFILED